MPTTQPALGLYGGAIKFGEETTWGTEAARTKAVCCDSISLSRTDEPKVSEVICGSSRFTSEVYQGVVAAGGDFSFPVRYEGAELLFKHLFGSVTTTHPGTLAYLHTFAISDTVLEGLSIEKAIDSNLATGKSMLYTGCRINSMDFTLETDGTLMCSTNVIAKNEELEETPTTLTTSTSGLALWSQAAVTFGSAITAKVSAFSLSVNNNLAGDRYRMGSRYTYQPVRSGKIEVSGSMTVEFDANTLYNLFLNQTTTSLSLVLTGALIETTNYYSMTFSLPYCKISGFPVNPEDQNVIMVEMPFVAFADSSAAREITLAVQNTLTSV
jgi:hypothetical protein